MDMPSEWGSGSLARFTFWKRHSSMPILIANPLFRDSSEQIAWLLSPIILTVENIYPSIFLLNIKDYKSQLRKTLGIFTPITQNTLEQLRTTII